MNQSKILKGFMILIVLAMLAGGQQAVQANTRVIENGDYLPFYARWFDTDNGAWVVWVFYHSPDCIPASFNLLEFFTPGAADCLPSTTEGFMIYEHGLGIDEGPILSLLKGKGAVPVWLISLQDYFDAVSDEQLTIEELATLPSLQRGLADFYQETFRPYPIAVTNTMLVEARGKLMDGRDFKFHMNHTEANYNAKITLRDQ